MKPTAEQALTKLAGQILLNHTPLLGDNYQGSELKLTGAILLLTARHIADDALHSLAEAAALRHFFASQADVVGERDSSLGKRMHTASKAVPLPTTGGQAEQQLDDLRSVLMDYQIWVETHCGENSEENRQIWALLAERHAARRIRWVAV